MWNSPPNSRTRAGIVRPHQAKQSTCDDRIATIAWIAPWKTYLLTKGRRTYIKATSDHRQLLENNQNNQSIEWRSEADYKRIKKIIKIIEAKIAEWESKYWKVI